MSEIRSVNVKSIEYLDGTENSVVKILAEVVLLSGVCQEFIVTTNIPVSDGMIESDFGGAIEITHKELFDSFMVKSAEAFLGGATIAFAGAGGLATFEKQGLTQ